METAIAQTGNWKNWNKQRFRRLTGGGPQKRSDMKVFSVDGYFLDDESEFSNYLIAEYDNTPNGYSDEDIFFYGLDEDTIKRCIAEKDPVGDFLITEYRVYDETEAV